MIDRGYLECSVRADANKAEYYNVYEDLREGMEESKLDEAGLLFEFFNNSCCTACSGAKSGLMLNLRGEQNA